MEYTDEALEFNMLTRKSFPELVRRNMYEVKNKVREIIKERWLSGQSVYGGNITNQLTGLGYSNPLYAKLKLSKNPRAGGHVDLTFTGSLGDKITLQEVSGGDYMIVSTDSKYDMIGSKYGYEEFGLTPEETEKVLDILEDIIFNELNL